MAANGRSTHADEINFSAAISVLCCLTKTVLVKLSFTIFKTGTAFFNLGRFEELLSMALKQYIGKVASKLVPSARRARVVMTTWVP